MSLTPEQIDILFDAAEDCTPLWDAKWEYSRPSKNDPELALIKQAKRGVDEMLASGLISLSRGGGTETMLPCDEARRLIRDINYWHPSTAEDSAYLCLSITEDGKVVLYQDERVKAYYKSDEFLARYPDPEWHPMKRS